MRKLLKHFLFHPATTIAGLAIIGGGIYTGVTKRSTWTESSIVITLGVGLLPYKKVGKKEKCTDISGTNTGENGK